MGFFQDPGGSLDKAWDDAKNGGVNIGNTLELGGDIVGAIYGGYTGWANAANYLGNQTSRATGGTGSWAQDAGAGKGVADTLNIGLGLGTAYESTPASWGGGNTGAYVPTWAGGDGWLSDTPVNSGGMIVPNSDPAVMSGDKPGVMYDMGFQSGPSSPSATSAGYGGDGGMYNSEGAYVPATPPATPSVAGAGGSGAPVAPAGMSTAQKIALGLGATNSLYSLSQAGKSTSMQDQQQQAALTQQQQAQDLINKALSGQLNPADQSRLAQSRQDSINAKKAYYAQAGLSDSSMAQQDIASINQQYDQAAYAITQTMLTQGLNATGVANGAVQQAVTAQINSDAKLQAAQQQFFAMLMQYGLKG